MTLCMLRFEVCSSFMAHPLPELITFYASSYVALKQSPCGLYPRQRSSHHPAQQLLVYLFARENKQKPWHIQAKSITAHFLEVRLTEGCVL